MYYNILIFGSWCSGYTIIATIYQPYKLFELMGALEHPGTLTSATLLPIHKYREITISSTCLHNKTIKDGLFRLQFFLFIPWYKHGNGISN